MDYAELHKRAQAWVGASKSPWPHLTPRKRKKRWKLLMKQSMRGLYCQIVWPPLPQQTIMWSDIHNPTKWTASGASAPQPDQK